MSDWSDRCFGCGQCCGIVPIDKRTFESNQMKIKIEYHATIYNQTAFATKKDDPLECAFLDENKQCLIYQDRPEVCRLFGTIKKLECKFYPLEEKETSNDTHF